MTETTNAFLVTPQVWVHMKFHFHNHSSEDSDGYVIDERISRELFPRVSWQTFV